MTKIQQNLQDMFLNQARRHRTPLTVFLVNGFQMRGVVTGFDSYVIVLESDGKQQIIYKHAVSTIAPAYNIALNAQEEASENADKENIT